MTDPEPTPIESPTTNSAPAKPPDRRLYVPDARGWTARIKQSWDNDYCYNKNPGEDYFHLLLGGEIFVQHGDEKYCLNCALKLGLVTTDRQYWQRPGARGAAEE